MPVALVTGGTSGIGRLTGELLLQEGWSVAFVGRNEAVLEELANGATESRVAAIPADVRVPGDVSSATHAAIDKFGQLDLVIVGAGVLEVASMESSTPDHWNRVLETNLSGAFFAIQATLDHILASKGRYVLLSSVAGHKGLPNLSAYSAAKSGLRSLGESLATETEGRGVSVHTLMLGPIATPMLDLPGASDFKLDPRRVAEVILWLTGLPKEVICRELTVRERVT